MLQTLKLLISWNHVNLGHSLIQGIFGVQIEYLRYVSWLFKNNVFMWIMLVFIILSAIYYVWIRRYHEK